MNFIEELEWRGMLHDRTPGVDKILSQGGIKGYIGFDPTAPSLTIGNYVQIMLLDLFQRCGHTPIVLMGGATGRIGDPSGKDQERQLKSIDELDYNLEHQQKQAAQFLNFESGDNKAVFRNNYDFYSGMNVLDFLRDVGKHLTINYMMSKDSVKNRLESGLSFTEFSYQLIQGYDFVKLYQQDNCMLQMGGSDQWGNITAGTELVRRMTNGKTYAVTTPLLTKANGQKFGKSESGNIWLDPELTTPYQFYQFWIQADDADLPKFIRYFSLKSRAEVESMEGDLADNPQMLKKILAEEVTRRVHSDEAYDSVLNVTNLIFNSKASAEQLLALSENELSAVSKEITSFTIPMDKIKNGINIIDLVVDATNMLSSKSEARRSIKGNALAVNKEKVSDEHEVLNAENLLQGKYLLIENGKKNKFIIEAV